MYDKKLNINRENLELLKKLVTGFVYDVLGLKNEQAANDDLPKVLNLIVTLRNDAKLNHDYATSDKIRKGLQKIGFQLNDSKEGTNWSKI